MPSLTTWKANHLLTFSFLKIADIAFRCAMFVLGRIVGSDSVNIIIKYGVPGIGGAELGAELGNS